MVINYLIAKYVVYDGKQELLIAASETEIRILSVKRKSFG